MLKIVYACNDKLFNGLYLSILSIVRRTEEDVAFYLLTADCSSVNPQYFSLTSEHAQAITNMVKKYNPHNQFHLINAEKECFDFLKNSVNIKNHFTPYTMFRIFLDRFSFFTGKVLYLDIDTMACGDIKEMFAVELGNHEFATCHNYSGRIFLRNNPFNAGVILFNMEACRKSKLFDKTRDLVLRKKFTWPEQTAFYLASSDFIYFPQDEYRFNRQQIRVRKGDIIKHFSAHFIGWPFFNNIKQWDIKNVHRHLHIHTFDEDYRIFLEDLKTQRELLKNEYYINVSHLRKYYGNIKAIDDVSFKVKKGALFAFLGVNGAGKSTTINIISSTLNKDSGDITIGGYDLVKENAEVKEQIGIVFQNSSLDNLLSVKENLEIRARFYNMDKNELDLSIKRVTDMLHLEPILNQAVGKLSGGQRRRVDIARALIHEPKLLMLDEPTTGLDPKTRLDVWRLIDLVRQKNNMTVFLTTHYLEEADKATDVVIMNKGKVIAKGTPNELKNKYSSDILIAYREKDKSFEKTLKGYKYRYDCDSHAYRILIKNGADAKKMLHKCDRYIEDFEIQKGNMDSVFLNVTRGLK